MREVSGGHGRGNQDSLPTIDPFAALVPTPLGTILEGETVVEAGDAVLRIVGARGHVIRTHRFVDLPRDTTSWVWDGRNQQGSAVGSENYRAMAKFGEKRRSSGLTLVRRACIWLNLALIAPKLTN